MMFDLKIFYRRRSDRNVMEVEKGYMLLVATMVQARDTAIPAVKENITQQPWYSPPNTRSSSSNASIPFPSHGDQSYNITRYHSSMQRTRIKSSAAACERNIKKKGVHVHDCTSVLTETRKIWLMGSTYPTTRSYYHPWAWPHLWIVYSS